MSGPTNNQARSSQVKRNISKKDRQIHRWRVGGCLVQHVGYHASVVGLVIDDMQQHVATRHGTRAAIHELEVHDLVMCFVGEAVRPRRKASAFEKISTCEWNGELRL